MIKKKRQLYVGLDPVNFKTTESLTHLPLIKIVPTSFKKVKQDLVQFTCFTHIIITSKSTVSLLLGYLKKLKISLKEWQTKTVIAVGKGTRQELIKNHIDVAVTAKETSEGIIIELKKLNLEGAYFFWPHSTLSRPLIRNFFLGQQLRFKECLLYHTTTATPSFLPCLEEFEEIIFTSPSTIDAFLQIFGSLPQNKTLTTLGPVTALHLKKIVFPS